jgi:hypothetical protein
MVTLQNISRRREDVNQRLLNGTEQDDFDGLQRSANDREPESDGF